MPTPGTSTPEYPWGKPFKWPNPLKAMRERRELAAFVARNQARIGTGAEAVAFAIEHIDDHFDRLQFLKDWQVGDLEEWPDYRPASPQPPALTAHGYLLRSSAILAGFFAALMLLADLLDAAMRGGDPIRILLTCSWGAAVLICAGAAWAAALKPRGEG